MAERTASGRHFCYYTAWRHVGADPQARRGRPRDSFGALRKGPIQSRPSTDTGPLQRLGRPPHVRGRYVPASQFFAGATLDGGRM